MSQPTIISVWYQVRPQRDNKQAHKHHLSVSGVSCKCTFLTFNSSWLLYFLSTTKKISRITHWLNYMLNIEVKLWEQILFIFYWKMWLCYIIPYNLVCCGTHISIHWSSPAKRGHEYLRKAESQSCKWRPNTTRRSLSCPSAVFLANLLRFLNCWTCRLLQVRFYNIF